MRSRGYDISSSPLCTPAHARVRTLVCAAAAAAAGASGGSSGGSGGSNLLYSDKVCPAFGGSLRCLSWSGSGLVRRSLCIATYRYVSTALWLAVQHMPSPAPSLIPIHLHASTCCLLSLRTQCDGTLPSTRSVYAGSRSLAVLLERVADDSVLPGAPCRGLSSRCPYVVSCDLYCI